MGQIDQKPAETYLRWVERLNRLLQHGGFLPQTEISAISAMANIFQSQGHYPTAEVFSIGLFSLGNAYRILGHERISSAFYSKAVHYNPNLVPAHYNLGNYHRRKRRFEQATACYERALKIEPDNYLTNVNLAAVYSEIGNWQEGVFSLVKAIQTSPNKPLAYQALSQLCQLHAAFSFLLDWVAGHPQKDGLGRLLVRNLQIGYSPPLGLHGVYITIPETDDLNTDYTKARVVAALADATSTVLRSSYSANSFRAFLTSLDHLAKEAAFIKFPEAQFTIHFLRSLVYAGQCLDAFSSSLGAGTDIMQEPIAFVLSCDEQQALFGDLTESDFRQTAWKEMEKAFLVAYRNGVGRNLDPLQLSGVLARNLIHLSSEANKLEKAIFYIEATRAMLQQAPEYEDLERLTRVTALRTFLKKDEAIVLFYYYEIVVDILLVIVVTADRIESYSRALDFTQMKGLEPRCFLTAHKHGIESVTSDVEEAFYRVLIEPLSSQLEGITNVSFVPYSYLRNIPVHLIGEHESLWNRSSTRTYRYLPSVRCLLRKHSSRRSMRRCIIVAYEGEKGTKLNVTEELSSISPYFDEVVVTSDLGERSLTAHIKNGNFDYLHIACHCGFDADRKEFFLRLEHGRHYLVSHAVLGYLNFCHVFLNACSTGKDVIDHAYGDSLVNAANVFFRDDVQTVVATFWPVADYDFVKVG